MYVNLRHKVRLTVPADQDERLEIKRATGSWAADRNQRVSHPQLAASADTVNIQGAALGGMMSPKRRLL